MSSISLRHLRKHYHDQAVIHDLSLEIADGEFVALVGPSGCGKSTLLRMVAGLEDIHGGEIRLGDRLVNDVAPTARDLAMVFQNYALYPHKTVAGNLGFALKMQRLPRAEIDRRVREVAAVLGLEDLLERRPAQLSGGQRQRVAMGRAIVREPQVFLMDEPLSNLDAKLRVQMRAEISAVVRALNTTTLYVTHDQTEAMTMGDRMAVMKAGVLNQLGSPSECYDSPNNIFVAQFVGSPPMNLVMADVLDKGDRLVLKVGAIELTAPPALLERKPALRGFVGKKVVMGVRSEDMEDSSLREGPTDQRLQAKITLTEALGSEIIVHFTFDAERVETADTQLLAKESGEQELNTLGEGVKWVASFAPRSRVRNGDTVEISVDMERVHLFDPQDSEDIRR